MAKTKAPKTMTRTRGIRARRMLEGLHPDTRVVIADVTWEDYERVAGSIREGENCRVAFDGRDIEMLTLGPLHERRKSLLELFIAFVAGELKIRRQPMGSATWRRKALGRAVESDLCYYFDPAKLAAARAAVQSDDTDDYPNPDLAVEVDISRPRIDRPGIYARLGVTEIWRASQGSVLIEQLSPDGTYVPARRSHFLPVRPEDVTRWVFHEDSQDLVTWEERLREWVRSELIPAANA